MVSKLSDVAKRAGVSTATASRVLNNRTVMPIPATTAERIRKAARDLGYRPNAMARALLTGKTRALGLFSSEMSDPHFAQMLEATEAAAQRLGYHVVVSSSLDAVSSPGRVDGLLVVANPNDDRFSAPSAPMPTLFVNSRMEPTDSVIGWSDADGMDLAARHLIELGHQRIAALFCYGEDLEEPPAKVAGFRRAVESAGVEWREYWQGRDAYVVRHTNQFENGYLAAKEMLAGWEQCTALVARNDFIALGALRAIREAGLSVPQDVSVVGYTDSVVAACAEPPLTSVRTPIAEAGAMAVELLTQALKGCALERAGAMLPVSLTVRASTGPPGAGRKDPAVCAVASQHYALASGHSTS